MVSLEALFCHTKLLFIFELNTYTLAKLEQRLEHGYAVYSPSEAEINRELKAHFIPRVRSRKILDVTGFTLITLGFLLELISFLTSS